VTVEYLLNNASAAQIAEHLLRCDADFVPPLSGRVKISDYAEKIANRAARFEAWSDGALVGMVAAYCNDREKGIAYVTSVSVLREWVGRNIAAHLMNQCVEHAKALRMNQVALEVAGDNVRAVRLYEKCGFIAGRVRAPFIDMNLYLKGGEEHE
jgi:ribosomal protein S18 acetylase RimI-like enzyme